MGEPARAEPVERSLPRVAERRMAQIDQHPLLGALGLCRKAGKLLHGYDRVQENALRGKVALVLLTSDASERTVSHMKDACDGIVACEQMPLTSADLAMLTPKPAAVFGVTDEHLAQLCAKYL